MLFLHTLFIFTLYRAPVDTSPVTEGVTQFKHRVLLLLLLLLLLLIKTRVERQTITNSHVCVRHPWETCSFVSFSESVSTLNHQIFTYFVQRRPFLSSCYHFNLKQAFKVNNLAPMTMHHGRRHWSRALCQVSGRACSCRRVESMTSPIDPC